MSFLLIRMSAYSAQMISAGGPEHDRHLGAAAIPVVGDVQAIGGCRPQSGSHLQSVPYILVCGLRDAQTGTLFLPASGPNNLESL